jgi:hypothetical protein
MVCFLFVWKFDKICKNQIGNSLSYSVNSL